MLAATALSFVARCTRCLDAGFIAITCGPRAGDAKRCPKCSIDLDDDNECLEDSDAYVDAMCDRADEERSTVFAGGRLDWSASR